jgi:hypothetical protein
MPELPDIAAYISALEPKALSNSSIVLKRWVFGPNGPRIKVKAVQEIVVNTLHGESCT